jgi:hypothetical protein
MFLAWKSMYPVSGPRTTGSRVPGIIVPGKEVDITNHNVKILPGT